MRLMWILGPAVVVIFLLVALLGFAIRRADGRNEEIATEE